MENGNNVAQGQSGNHTVLDIDLEEFFLSQHESDEGLTTQEWADKKGIGIRKAQALIKSKVKDGTLVCGRKHVSCDWDGRARHYTVYRPK